jgi:hypothetical protein
MEWAFHLMPLNEAIAQFGVAMGAGVVHGKKLTVHLKNGQIMASRIHRQTRPVKHIGR